MDHPLTEWVNELLRKVEEQGHPLPTKFVLNYHPAHLLSVINARVDQIGHTRLLPGPRSTLLNVATALGLHHQATPSNDDEIDSDGEEDDVNADAVGNETQPEDPNEDDEEDSDDDELEDAPKSSKQNDKANTLRQEFQQIHRATTIKCMLKTRLDNPERDIPIIDELVGHVSSCARAGSERFNAWLLHQLATSSDAKAYGKLPVGVEIGKKKYLMQILLPCFRDTHGSLPQHIASVPNVQLITHHPGRIVGDKQSITYAARQYCTAFKNHVKVNFFKRVYRFCKVICHAAGLRKGVLYHAASLMYTTVMQDTPVVALHALLQAMPCMSKMIQTMRVWVAGVKRGRPAAKFKCMVEALFMMSVHNMVRGRPVWSVAPIHRLSRMHVAIDPIVWQQFIAPRHKELGVYRRKFNYSQLATDECCDHLMAIFNKNLHALRSAKKGWIPTSSLKTDGYSLCVTFFNKFQLKPSNKSRDEDDDENTFDEQVTNIPNNAQYLGGDIGDVSAITTAGFRDGVPWIRNLKTKDINIRSGKKGFQEQQKRRTSRVQTELDALSDFGSNGYLAAIKTPSLERQASYLEASSMHANAFRATIGHKHVCRGKMAVYGGQCRVIDEYLHSLPIYPNRPIVLAYGAANWAPIAASDRPPAPRSLVYKRAKLWADHVVMTDEYNTTKKQFNGKGIGLDVVEKGSKIVIRGLKGDASHKALSRFARSQLPRGTAFAMVVMDGNGEHKCKLCDDPAFPDAFPCVLMSRDGNAALNIRECVARGGHRPKYLRRCHDS